MKEHRVIHWTEQHYECQQCGRKFSDKNNLRRHQRALHSPASQSKQQYDIQNIFIKINIFKIFSRLNTHHGPLSCPACGKGFKTKKDLDRHQLTHSKVKIF